MYITMIQAAHKYHISTRTMKGFELCLFLVIAHVDISLVLYFSSLLNCYTNFYKITKLQFFFYKYLAMFHHQFSESITRSSIIKMKIQCLNQVLKKLNTLQEPTKHKQTLTLMY